MDLKSISLKKKNRRKTKIFSYILVYFIIYSFLFFVLFFSTINSNEYIKEVYSFIEKKNINFQNEEEQNILIQKPFSFNKFLKENIVKETSLKNKSLNDTFTPKDRIKEEQIKVYKDKVVIKIKNAEWSKFENTNSMIPFLDGKSNAIQIKPVSEEELNQGDIISYSYNLTEENNKKEIIIIHRIVKIGYDEKGWYAITKGDNNQKEDPEKVRFSQIKRVLVAIIY